MFLLFLLVSCKKDDDETTIKPKEPSKTSVEEKEYATPELSKMLHIIYDFEGELLVDNDGTTNFGVLEENWIKYLSDKKLDYKPVTEINKADADGYYEYYWKGEDLFKRKDHINLYPNMTYSLALVVFDSKVLDGYGKKDSPDSGSFEILQKVLNEKNYSKDAIGKLLDEDGDFGKDSVNVLKSIPKEDQKSIANAHLDERDIFHCEKARDGVKNGKYNDGNNPIEGWLERVQTLRELIVTLNDETGDFTYKGKVDHFENLDAAKNYCEKLLSQQ